MAKRKFEGEPTNFGEWLLKSLQDNDITRKKLAYEIAVAENSVGCWVLNQRNIGVKNLVWVCVYLSQVSGRPYEELIVEASLFFK